MNISPINSYQTQNQNDKKQNMNFTARVGSSKVICAIRKKLSNANIKCLYISPGVGDALLVAEKDISVAGKHNTKWEDYYNFFTDTNSTHKANSITEEKIKKLAQQNIKSRWLLHRLLSPSLKKTPLKKDIKYVSSEQLQKLVEGES